MNEKGIQPRVQCWTRNISKVWGNSQFSVQENVSASSQIIRNVCECLIFSYQHSGGNASKNHLMIDSSFVFINMWSTLYLAVKSASVSMAVFELDFMEEWVKSNGEICNYVLVDWVKTVFFVIYCKVKCCPVGGSTVPLEYEAGCVCEARARESHQPCEHSQCEDRPGEHFGWAALHDLIKSWLTARNISAWPTRAECVCDDLEVWGWVSLLFQVTRGLSGSHSSSVEHPLGLLTATWPPEVRKSWGTVCVWVYVSSFFLSTMY